MFEFETTVRIRYGETDQMGYAYYGNYALYYEVGRVEALRALGISYKKLEDEGILLPVFEYKSKFIKPAYYDDEITIKVCIAELPQVRIKFDYELYNSHNELINTGEVILVFLEKGTEKPCRAPDYVLNKMAPYFK